MEKNLAKTYDPKDFEDRIYEMWESRGAFRAERDPDKKPFTIVMPPPNITGQLHMGHALDQTLQDVLTRFKRLQGYSALWLPGSDHASIATEVKVVDRIRQEEGKEKERVFTGTPERIVNICLASISALIIYWTVYVSADVMWKHGLYIMTVFCMTLVIYPF